MSKELDDAISIVLEHATPDEAAVIQGCMSIINQPRILETSVGDIHLFNAFVFWLRRLRLLILGVWINERVD